MTVCKIHRETESADCKNHQGSRTACQRCKFLRDTNTSTEVKVRLTLEHFYSCSLGSIMDRMLIHFLTPLLLLLHLFPSKTVLLLWFPSNSSQLSLTHSQPNECCQKKPGTTGLLQISGHSWGRWLTRVSRVRTESQRFSSSPVSPPCTMGWDYSCHPRKDNSDSATPKDQRISMSRQSTQPILIFLVARQHGRRDGDAICHLKCEFW